MRRGAVDRAVAGRGNNPYVTPTSSFPREGTAQVRALFFLLLIALVPACKPDIKETGASAKYFDLQGYFKTEAARRAKLSVPILKTVTHNGATESKRVKINNWPRELNLFIESDINKAAWRDSYQIQQTDHTLIYMAKDTTLKTREIIINKKDGKVQWITIYNYTHNILYTNHEKLSYMPDSIYQIEKTQHVKLLGINRYTITGYLKQP
ncbi:MAG: hypothetical protein ABI367_00920 [Mucilaginibacter sp.]